MIRNQMAALRAGDHRALTGNQRRFKLGKSMGRTITLLSALWAFSIPVLCTAGVLVHPCDCESPTGCGHETECSDDPCNVTVIVQNGSSHRVFEHSEFVAVPLDHTPLVVIEAMRCSLTSHRLELTWRDNRPYADSDVPLLI